MRNEKKFAAALSITSNAVLIVIKFIAGIISGSIGIISEAVHSLSDLLASLIAFFSVSKSAEPADKEHSFGHGKYEDLSGFVEGGLIILAALYIVWEASKKMLSGEPFDINTEIGIVVMLTAVIVNIFVSGYLFHIAKRTESMALYADAEHLRTDIYSSLAVFVGLLAVKVTGIAIFDPIIAIVVAGIIFYAGLKICKESSDNLLDISLAENEIAKIKEIVTSHLGDEVIVLETVRTRRSGIKKNIELTLSVNRQLHISTAHKLCDEIEQELDAALGHTDVTIHLEPAE